MSLSMVAQRVAGTSCLCLCHGAACDIRYRQVRGKGDDENVTWARFRSNKRATLKERRPGCCEDICRLLLLLLLGSVLRCTSVDAGAHIPSLELQHVAVAMN